ncbi:hypothetical protein [Streptomyces syringium]|uniref:hypothetical protein n=1 Tax=Streptomyces syringium TaxID=76729 RepID=UPI00341D608F
MGTTKDRIGTTARSQLDDSIGSERLTPLPKQPPCLGCKGIKTARNKALHAGHTDAVQLLTTAFGRHQRSAHP